MTHHVVFAVPFMMDATLRFVRAAADLPGVRLGIVSQEPAERMPADLRGRIAGFEQVRNPLDAGQLVDGVRALARQWGGQVDRLIGILEPLQEPMAEARQALGLPGMKVEASHNFRDKARMKDVLRESGLPCAAHGLCRSAAEAMEFARRQGLPLVGKPPAGAGAKNTFRVDHLDQLESYLRTQPPRPDAPILLEEFLQGHEYSFDSVSIDGRHVFSSVTEYYPTPLEVMENAWIQWAVLLPRRIDTPEFADIHEAGPRALTALGMDTGITHMEWFRREDGSIAISEVAARPPGAQFTTLLSIAHDLDFYRAWARLVITGEFEIPERRWACGAAFLRGQGSGRVKAVHGIDEAQKELGEMVFEARLPQVGQPAASSYEGEGYVILRGEETEAVKQGLQRVVSLLQVELAE